MGIVGSVWGVSSIIGLYWEAFRICNMALAIFINIPIAIIAIILVFITYHFPNEQEVKASNFDVKGITLFYIFILLLMIGLLYQHMIVINIISILLAVIVLFGLFKFEAQIKQPFTYC